ncbi:hypothetical protein J3458_019351 [Metarhizium acridum]|uniref:uncharacterized protein n=1 Tax=Metarhizium acridum TaxID=92637 RepID=UPI001C6CA9B7|nr:hypothetical protein J3458_019351 [Metarhizium acridum]
MSDDDMFNEMNEACKKLQPDEYLRLCELAIHAAMVSGNDGRLTTLLNTPGIKATVEDDAFAVRQALLPRGDGEAILGAGATDESLGEMKRPTQWHLDDRHATLSPRIGAEQTPRVRDAKMVEIVSEFVL